MTATERLAEIDARRVLGRSAIPDGTGAGLYALDQIVLHDIPALVATIRAVQAALAEAYERIGGCCSGTDNDMCDRCRLYEVVAAALDGLR